MATEQKKALSAAKNDVKAKVKEEYEAFLKAYKDMPEAERFEKMVDDSEKIAFYHHVYVIIVIIGELDPHVWRALDGYYFDAKIIEDGYRSFKAFKADEEAEEETDEPSGKPEEETDMDWVNAYLNGADVIERLGASA
jgi:hypothetical protein